MSVSEMFRSFLNNIKIDNATDISKRYGEITSSLNKKFSDSDSKTANSLQVGSYGRHTGIKGISDLDMLYIMPEGKWDTYKNNQYKLLADTKVAIESRYPKIKVKVDRLVVQVIYKSFKIEVQPVFKIGADEKFTCFKYPDTYGGGSWKITKPKHEIAAMKEFITEKNKNLRLLCKMIRAWKNKHGIEIGGLLIDTLAYNFLKSTNAYDDKSYMDFDKLNRDFFKYLTNERNQDYYSALGSNQRVKVRKKFQKQAKIAYDLCLDAINAENTEDVNKKWKAVFGRHFPENAQKVPESCSVTVWDNTEEFIEDDFSVDIQYTIQIDCDVLQNGFRKETLRNMLLKKIPLRSKKKLTFKITSNNVPEPFTIKWKVLNHGPEAEKRNCIRGFILDDEGHMERRETTNFSGNHSVECYALKDEVIVARSRIDVPIR